jgi:hypothetical protein
MSAAVHTADEYEYINVQSLCPSTGLWYEDYELQSIFHKVIADQLNLELTHSVARVAWLNRVEAAHNLLSQIGPQSLA